MLQRPVEGEVGQPQAGGQVPFPPGGRFDAQQVHQKVGVVGFLLRR
jgi:hypothetical protein